MVAPSRSGTRHQQGQWLVALLVFEAIGCALARNGPAPPPTPTPCSLEKTNAPANSKYSDCENIQPGKTCTVTCDTGYDAGEQSATFTCEADGKFSGSLTCEPVSCGPAPSPADSTGCSGSKTYEESCTATCEPGYTGGQKTSATFTCGADGTYSGDPLTCKRVSCGKPPLPLHSHSDDCHSSMKYGDTCTATCDVFYGKYKKTGTQKFTCGRNGEYSESLTCNLVTCGSKSPSEHSDKCPRGQTAPASGSGADPHTCSVHCAYGYADEKHTGPDASHTNVSYTCTEDPTTGDGHWVESKSGSGLNCAAVTCPELPPISGSHQDSSSLCTTGTYLETCKVKCELGYHNTTPTETSSNTAAVYTCRPKRDDPQKSPTGEWTPPQPHRLPLMCTGYKCEGAPQVDSTAIKVSPEKTNKGFFPSRFTLPDKEDSPACKATHGQRGRYLNNASVWNCVAKPDGTGAVYMPHDKQPVSRRIVASHVVLGCDPCPGGVLDGCDNQTDAIFCHAEDPWEPPISRCTNCKLGYQNLGDRGCSKVVCNPVPDATLAMNRTVGPSCKMQSASKQCNDRFQPLQVTLRQDLDTATSLSMITLTTSVTYTCAKGHAQLQHGSESISTYTLYCDMLGRWVDANSVVANSTTAIPESLLMQQACRSCCTRGSNVSSCTKAGGAERDGKKRWANGTWDCAECLKPPPLAWYNVLLMFLVCAGVIATVFVLADFLKGMAPSLGPAMSLWTFCQTTYLQLTFGASDGGSDDNTHDSCLFGGSWSFICTDGLLGAASFDTQFLHNFNVTHYVMGVAEPHCAFDFLYDTEWFIMVTSPIMLAVVLLVGLALRILLVVLCNVWLPPKHRQDLHIPNPFRNGDQDDNERLIINFSRTQQHNASVHQPKIQTAVITIVLLPVLGPVCIGWWILWGVLSCCGQSPIKWMLLLDSARGPVQNACDASSPTHHNPSPLTRSGRVARRRYMAASCIRSWRQT